jgi:hypothetical protein
MSANAREENMPAAHVATHHRSQPSQGCADHVLNMISYGVPFRLSAESSDMLERMRRHAPWGSAAQPVAALGARNFALRSVQSDTRYRVLADGEVVSDNQAVAPALAQLSGHIMVYVAEHAPDLVFVHAGVVAWQDRALLLPGVSHAGKSTLVAEMVRAGATYYSDEFALLDPEGRVHPFARELGMRRPGNSEQTMVPVTQLNGCVGTQALTVAMIVFTNYAENACWAPEPMSHGRAVLEMLLHTAPVQRTPARVLATVSATVQNAAVWKSSRGEAAPAARALLAALATGGAPA